MLEHSIYSVISPEGCATILWRDAAQAPAAAEALKLTAEDLQPPAASSTRVVPEPLGGAHRDRRATLAAVGRRVAGGAGAAAGAGRRPRCRRAGGEKFLEMGREARPERQASTDHADRPIGTEPAERTARPLPRPRRSLRAPFLTVFPSIMLPMFLAAIDQTIVATALPAIAGSLGEVERVSWVVVSYLVATHHRGAGLWPARRCARAQAACCSWRSASSSPPRCSARSPPSIADADRRAACCRASAAAG